jgi:hypothetical protein
MWREKTKWFAAAAALFLVAAAVPYGRYYFENWQYQRQADLQSEISAVQTKATGLSNTWSDIEQRGGPDRQRITNVKTITAYRNLTTEVLGDVYRSLPQFAADAPKELKSDDPEQIKKIKRPERKQIVIESIRSVYRTNMSDVLDKDTKLEKFADENVAMQDVAPVQGMGYGAPAGYGGPPGAGGDTGGGGGLGDTGAPPDSGGGPAAPPGAQRGFILILRCTTPYADGVWLFDQVFIKNLEAIKPGAIPLDKPFYIARAGFGRRDRVKNDQTKIQKLNAQYQQRIQREAADAAAAAANAGGVGGGPPPMAPAPNFIAAQPGNALPVQAFQDSLGEDVRDDWEATIVVAVVLDPPPPAVAAAGTPGAPPTPKP